MTGQMIPNSKIKRPGKSGLSIAIVGRGITYS